MNSLKKIHTNHEKQRNKVLSNVRKTIPMEKEMGKKLGKCKILLKKMF